MEGGDTDASSANQTKVETETSSDANQTSSTDTTTQGAEYTYLAIGVMLEDYTAGYDNDISLPVGEKVYIWEMDNESWWKVQSQTSGVSGFVPASFIEITEDYRTFSEEGASEYYDYDAANQSSETPAPVAENTAPEALPQTEATA